MATWDGSTPLQNFTALQKVTASQLQVLVDALHGVTDAETAWTPTVRFGGTAWTLGNATRDCTIRRAGKLVILTGRIVVGSTTALGAGTSTMTVDLPVTARRGASPLTVGEAFVSDASPINNYLFTAYLASTTQLAFIKDAGVVSKTYPFTWTTSDSLSFTAIYEAA